tara:strand:+ start:26232 stop:27416 length:1185 start_codon:yes stop_codon:yes gene_type:complete
MIDKSIAIIGAGIGGLSLAITLKQAGFNNIQIFERTSSSHSIGAGLVLWPNAMCILSKMGLDDEIQEVSGKLSSMIRFSNSGEQLGALSIEKLDAKMGFTSHPITRKAIQEILIQKLTELEIEITYSKNVEEIEKDSNSIPYIKFSDGKTHSAEIIIGADGRMKSSARKYVTGNNTPIYQNYVNWVGLIEHKEMDINTTKSVHDYWGIGERFGFVPVDSKTAYWAGCKRLPLGLGEPSHGNKKELIQIFKHWPTPILEIIKTTAEENIKRIEVFDHHPINTWFLDNVCLLGDAAHAALPTSGQGACQAIEDAWHLAQCLSEPSITVSDAFEAYQTIRLEKANSIILGGRAFAQSLFNEDAVFCEARNENAKKADMNAQVDGMANLWGKNLPPMN